RSTARRRARRAIRPPAPPPSLRTRTVSVSTSATCAPPAASPLAARSPLQPPSPPCNPKPTNPTSPCAPRPQLSPTDRSPPAETPVALGPPHLRRHRRQDGVDVPTRLQAERRTAVIEQVELHIPPAAHQLLVTVSLAPRSLEVPPHQFRVDVEE